MVNNKLKEWSSKGLHNKCIEIIKNKITKDSKILVTGSGTGHFEHLLIDKLGVNPKNILSTDIEPVNFLVKDIGCHKLNLNEKLPFDNNIFDIIISLEVIEHLKNQWDFISELKRVKSKNGYILLSSPNIENIFNKIYFLFTNKFSYFSENDYVISGHINPLFTWNFYRMLEKNGLNILKYDSNLFYLWIIPFIFKIKVPFKSYLFAQLNIFLLN